MATKIPLSTLEEDERRAHLRLAAYKAKLYWSRAASPMAASIRLQELERKSKGAAERLRRARKRGQSRDD